MHCKELKIIIFNKKNKIKYPSCSSISSGGSSSSSSRSSSSSSSSSSSRSSSSCSYGRILKFKLLYDQCLTVYKMLACSGDF